LSITRGEKFSTTTSACAISRRASATPSGRDRSSVMPRFPGLMPWNIAAHSHQPSSVGGLVEAKRMPSGRCVDSTLITSAPSAAR
jgi:hypothetical protein